MLLCIPNVLSRDAARRMREAILGAEWEDGRGTAGSQSGQVKANRQLPLDCPQACAAGASVLEALSANPLFISAALPLRILPPMFNRYGEGETFGAHIDNAIRRNARTQEFLRTDLSATLFLNDPEDYDGGELTIETQFGAQQVKLPAGDMVLYPASSLHQVVPVTRGQRLASFFWVQSMVRQDNRRAMLFDLDQSIQELRAVDCASDASLRLIGVYHNLLREWAQT